MQHVLRLCIIIIAAPIAAATEANFSYPSDPDLCICAVECNRYESSPLDKVQVYKSTAKKDKIFCFASQPIRWTFGSNYNQMPRVDSQELQLQSSSFQRLVGHKYCLSLRVTPQFPSWNTSSLFARCETNATDKVSSKWYKLNPEWEFEGQDWHFNPNVTLSPKTSIEEAVETTEEASVNRTISVEPFNKATQHSTADHHSSSDPTTQPTIADPSLLPNPMTQQSAAGHTPSVPLTIVIAAAGGAAGFLLILVILLVVLVRIVKKQRKEIEMTNEEVDEFMLGVAAEKANAKGINGLFILPYNTKLEIPKSDLIFRSTVLGSGAFGQVVKGTYQGRQVAIKMLKRNASQNADYLRSLLGELKVMSYLGSHPHLVGLVGAITRDIKKGEAYLIFEFCAHGNAHKFVRDRRDNFVDLFGAQASSHDSGLKRMSRLSRISRFYGTVRPGVGLTTKDLLRWSYEVASGMEYVAAQNVYHGDLAARNILLTEDLTAKVGDFGLSKELDMETYNCYVQKKECPLPLKWMSIESLRDLTFSIQSDVWSFGVAMWELFTLGAIPYPGVEWNFESWKLLCEGKRLGKPEYASGSIYGIMMSCWNADPKSRPSFAQLRDVLGRELRKL